MPASPIHVGSHAMQALVYLGPGKSALQEHAKPDLVAATDAIV